MVVINVHGPRVSHGWSLTHGKHASVHAALPEDTPKCMLLQVQVEEQQGSLHITCTESTQVRAYSLAKIQDIKQMTEVCTGLGCLGLGAQQAGFQVRMQNELRPATCQVLRQNSQADIMEGDITNPEVRRQLAWKGPQHGTIAAGFSCQPFSMLGDRQGGNDGRASTLPATLALAHLMQSQVIILECVAEVDRDPWVQDQLQAFAAKHGYSISTRVLHLGSTWCTQRTRWWGVLTHHVIGRVTLHPLPHDPDHVTVGDVMPTIASWPMQALQELALSQYEARIFEDVLLDISKVHLRLDAKMQTALRSWGNQVFHCPCGCRSSGLTERRLHEKGLHTVLLPRSNCKPPGVEQDQAWYRHLHPSECALLCGLSPGLNWNQQYRLSLSLVGQLASPIQSLWISSQIMQRVQQLAGDAQCDPEAILRAYKLGLLQQRDQVWAGKTSHFGSPMDAERASSSQDEQAYASLIAGAD